MSNTLSSYVKEMRKQFGLTQVDLAAKSGVGLRFVRELEQGKETLRLDKVNQVFSLPFSGRKEPLCLRYLGVFSGNFGASCCKSVANFLDLYPLCHKGLQLFRQSRLLQIFLDGFLAECPTDFLSSLLLPIFTIIVGINTQRHVHRAVSSQILDLLYVQSSFKKTCDVSVAENMGS